MDEFLGYDDVLMSSVKALAEKDNNKGEITLCFFTLLPRLKISSQSGLELFSLSYYLQQNLLYSISIELYSGVINLNLE